MGSDSTEVQCFDDGGRVDGTAGWNCGKPDRMREVQGKVDGNDRAYGNARGSCGKAHSTRNADRTREAATAVGAVGRNVAAGTGSCVRCGNGGLLGGDCGRYGVVVLHAIHAGYPCLIQCHIPHLLSQRPSSRSRSSFSMVASNRL